MAEIAAALLALGQQALQQESGEQPTVCFAAVPLLIPPAVLFARALARQLRRFAPHSA